MAFIATKEVRDELARIYRWFFPKKTAFGRAACLGLDVFKYNNIDKRDVILVNQQKTRVDLLLEWLGGGKRPKADLIERHMARKDVFFMIRQQEKLPWLDVKGKIECLFMDSFSELTDQKFVHRKDNWAFACHYTDISHTPEFENDFRCEGLMDLNRLEEFYGRFFDWFQDHYPGKKVFYIHYPTKMDNRTEFKERGKKVRDVMDRISARGNIFNIYIDDEYVFPNEKDNFPYHYGKKTYEEFIKKIGAFEKAGS